jgi:tetratricopeptide (TPR) repeat protein
MLSGRGAGMHRWVVRTLAFAYLRLGDLERSRRLYQEALELARQQDDAELAAGSLGGLVGIALIEGNVGDAAGFAREGLHLVGDSRDVLMKTSRVAVAAEVVAAQGRVADAARLVAYTQGQYEDLGAVEPWVERDNAATLAIARSQLGEAALAEAMAEGRTLTSERAFALAEEALTTEGPDKRAIPP